MTPDDELRDLAACTTLLSARRGRDSEAARAGPTAEHAELEGEAVALVVTTTLVNCCEVLRAQRPVARKLLVRGVYGEGRHVACSSRALCAARFAEGDGHNL
jgi:hypothetical protein